MVHSLRARRDARTAPSDPGVDRQDQRHASLRRWLERRRERIFENQKKLGVVPANATLPPWPDFLPKWETLTADEKKLYLRQIDVWAAYMAYTDHEIGRVVETIEKLGLFDNTLIIWVFGDNGMSAEGSMNGTPNEVAYFNGFAYTVEQMLPLIPAWGTDQTYPHFAVPWAFAMDTPYRWCKQVASHLGGTRTGMVVTWPKRITDAGGIRHQFHHVIDIIPTIFDAVGIPQPTMVNGIAQRPWDGVSMVYSWDKASADAPSTRKTQYFEILGNRAIYHDGWMANTIPAVTPWEGVKGHPPVDVLNGFKWELFNLKEDPTQTNDLAAQEPERLKSMQELWMIEAVRNQVLPLNASQLAVLTVERPGPAAGRTQFVYTTPNTSNQFAVAPSILNRSYTITAEIEVPEGGANGVLVTQGGRFSGYGALSQGRQADLHHEPARPRAAEMAGPRRAAARQAHHRLRLEDGPDGHAGRARRHWHAVGERQAGGAEVVAPYPAVHLGLGRDVRRRPRHRHVGGRFRLSGAVRVHRHAGEDHLRPRRNEHDAGGHQGDDGGAGEEARPVRRLRRFAIKRQIDKLTIFARAAGS